MKRNPKQQAGVARMATNSTMMSASASLID